MIAWIFVLVLAGTLLFVWQRETIRQVFGKRKFYLHILNDDQTHPTCLLYTSPSPRD